MKLLTKGDNNRYNDRELYSPGQLWLEKKHLIGTIKGTISYLGIIPIYLNEYPTLKYAMLLIGIFYSYKFLLLLIYSALFYMLAFTLMALCVM